MNMGVALPSRFMWCTWKECLSLIKQGQGSIAGFESAAGERVFEQMFVVVRLLSGAVLSQ